MNKNREDNVTAIIQARMNSSRFPGKVLQKIGGVTVIEHMISRVRQIQKISDLLVATSYHKNDDKIISICKNLQVKYFRGDEHDVLSRFYHAGKHYSARHILRLTADCPMIDPEIADKIIEIYFKKNLDYCSNTVERTFADGLDVEIFKFKLLSLAKNKTNKLNYREHVTSYFNGKYKTSDKFFTYQYKFNKNFSYVRLTLDTLKDLTNINKIIKILPKNYRWKDIVELYKKSPNLFLIEDKYGEK